MKNFLTIIGIFFVTNIAFSQNDVNLHLPESTDSTSFILKNRDALTIFSSIGAITCLSMLERNKNMAYLSGAFIFTSFTLQIPEIKRQHNVKLHRRKK